MHTVMEIIRVIIVSMPGTSQRMLQNNIQLHASMKVVDVAHGSLSAVNLVDVHNPDLLVIDSSIPIDETLALIQNVKRENPGIQSVVLADTTRQRRKLAQAGADYTISSYNFPNQIGDIINQFQNHPSRAINSDWATGNSDPI